MYPADLSEGEHRGNLFVIQGISTARIGEIVRGTYPYYVIFLAVFTQFPELAQWLPEQMVRS